MSVRSSIASIIAVSLLGVAAPATAGDVERGPVPSGSRVHDGFYLRMAFGGGGFTSRDTRSDGASTQQPTYGGGGAAMELSIGGTPKPGLVVGSSALLQSTIVGTMRDSAGTTTVLRRQDYGLVGPTVDYFPEATRGLHVLATVGVAFMGEYRDDRVQKTWSSRGGAGISLGAGYDAWVSSNWSLGFLVRASAATLGATQHETNGNLSTATQDTQRAVAAIALTFSALYH